ncbi:type 1 glutamine amidotransferase [Zoogloea sp.]|uniref:type 1 glutamine amidotransferase n=1 Tax=Zoogloea sp. TaxID=49181 RepID=UPI0014156DC0|nr:MAG: type 1 glutamine amidotransferase [Zoogloea sp.]
MKPVAIIRHSLTEGPGHFATFLDSHSLPWTLIRIDAGDPVPRSCDDYSGLCLMGGPMSVNDELPWIPPLLDLIRKMIAADKPVIGHCLGGQLISKALGGQVTRNPVKEIGWGAVSVVDSPVAREWFGGIWGFESFHWHGETFSIPEGATRILESAACPNQAYVLGKHLGMQCHVEMTAAMIDDWCASGADEIAAAGEAPTVQSPESMKIGREARLKTLNQSAETLYTHWIKGL